MSEEQKKEQTEEEKIYEEAAKEIFEGKERELPPEEEEEGNLPAGSEEKEPPENPSPEVSPDPWAGVNPALRQTLESLNSTIAPLSERLKQAERRIGAIQNDYSAWKKDVEEKVNAPSQEEIAAAAQDEKDWKALEEEYPDWTEAVSKKLSQIQDEHERETQAALEQIESLKAQMQSESQQKGQIDETLERRLLGIRYPKYREIIQTKDYQQWLAVQPQDIIQKTFSPVAEDAIAVLDAFMEAKETISPKKDNKQQRLQEAVLPEGHEAIPPKSEEDMTDTEFRRKLASELWGKR